MDTEQQLHISREKKLEQVLNEIVKVINRAYMAQDIVLVEEDLNGLLRAVGVDTFHPAIKIVPNTRI